MGVTKYRYLVSVEDCGGIGLGWDGETPTCHYEWRLSNKPHKRDNATMLEDFEPLTDKQRSFLLEYANLSKDFIETRTKKEGIVLIGNMIEGWKRDKAQRKFADAYDAYEWDDYFGGDGNGNG